VADTITTPAGFTITPQDDGSYRICDPHRHCLKTNTLWEAQQLVQWAEVHHQDLGEGSTTQGINGSLYSRLSN
jgi:hypothetical protein